MCGGKVGQVVRNPVKAVSNSLSRVEDVFRATAQPVVSLVRGDAKGALDDLKNLGSLTADTIGLGAIVPKGNNNDAPQPAPAPDIAGQADQAAADASAAAVEMKSRRRRRIGASLFQAGPVLQQLAGASPKATLLGG